jgi:hypothetical protein
VAVAMEGGIDTFKGVQACSAVLQPRDGGCLANGSKGVFASRCVLAELRVGEPSPMLRRHGTCPETPAPWSTPGELHKSRVGESAVWRLTARS